MANWLSRWTGQPSPTRKRTADGQAFEPVPQALQTALPSDLTVVDTSKFGYTLASVRESHPFDGKTGPGTAAKSLLARILDRIGLHSQVLTNFRAQVTNASELVIPYNPMRCYLLVVNTGTAEVRISYNRAADVQTGLPLSAGGGFHEPILGTVSSMHAVSTVAAVQTLIIVEGYYSWGSAK